jgi:hypothetical protein
MRPAIPFEIVLIPRETEAARIPREELLRRVNVAFPEAEIDQERGRSEVLHHMQKLLDMGTPEILVQGSPPPGWKYGVQSRSTELVAAPLAFPLE